MSEIFGLVSEGDFFVWWVEGIGIDVRVEVIVIEFLVVYWSSVGMVVMVIVVRVVIIRVDVDNRGIYLGFVSIGFGWRERWEEFCGGSRGRDGGGRFDWYRFIIINGGEGKLIWWEVE